MGKNGEKITKRRLETFQSEYEDKTICELHEVLVERGVSFEQAMAKLSATQRPHEGFYADKVVHSHQTRKVVLVSEVKVNNAKVLYTLMRPNVGVLTKLETLEGIRETMENLEPEDARPVWEKLHAMSENVCSHYM